MLGLLFMGALMLSIPVRVLHDPKPDRHQFAVLGFPYRKLMFSSGLRA